VSATDLNILGQWVIYPLAALLWWQFKKVMLQVDTNRSKIHDLTYRVLTLENIEKGLTNALKNTISKMEDIQKEREKNNIKMTELEMELKSTHDDVKEIKSLLKELIELRR